MVTTATASRHRFVRGVRRRLPALSLTAGIVALAGAVPLVVVTGPSTDLPWFVGSAVFVACATFVWRRRPHEPIAWWFAVSGGLVALIQALDGLMTRAAIAGVEPAVPWVVLGFQLMMTLGGIAIAHLIGLFPDGRLERRVERRVLGCSWALLALPPLVLLGRPTLLLPSYARVPELPNPYAVSALEPLGTVASWGVAMLQGVFAVGVVLLVLRYRRSTEERRRRIRWLLLPALFAAAVAVVDLAFWHLFDGAPSTAADVTMSALWIATIASLPVAIAIALVRPHLLDIERVVRQSLVYGSLWVLIAAAYVIAAAGLGLAAGRHLPLGLALALTVAATLVFHPARLRLGRLADHWVFGPRTDPARLISRLGSTLADTVELEQLLPRMATAVRDGLGLEWVRVRLEPAAPVGEDPPVLTVPIVLDGERLGVVECGPKQVGALTGADEAVVVTLARQAALAVRNVRLTAELEASRLRLVRAQDAERRRIERNIHDGVQQDLVALVGAAAHARRELARSAAAGEEAVGELQAGLARVVSDLRELAHGIHPSLLSDRGLLEAVEALAARSTVPVSVRADPSLRGLRFAEAAEGAGYFTVAEALANVSKHAGASSAEVSLARANGSLRITVVDDGSGFDPVTVQGEGLANLAERLAALGGGLEVASTPGVGTTVTAELEVIG